MTTTAQPHTAIHTHTFPNGLTLLAEPIAGAQSLSMQLLTPAGVAIEPGDQQGVGTVLAEMMCRGAGGKSAREHSEALERLGVRRDADVNVDHLDVSATMLGPKLDQALPLLLDMAQTPNLDDQSLPPSRDLAVQAIDALEDEPQRRTLIELRKRHMPDPYGRSAYGKREHLEQLSADHVRRFHQHGVTAEGSILAFAGKLDWDHLRDLVGELTADWAGTAPPSPQTTDPPRGYSHEKADSSQVHIGLAYDAVAEADERSMLQRAATAVLSGGMSGRLFTEVREKRGLCYAVAARYTGRRDRGIVSAYAGTTTPRAQETLDVLSHELRRLKDGLTEDEFQRAVVGMKSKLVMQGESTGARAAAIASDQYVVGRPRSLEELAKKVDAITLDDLRQFVADHAPDQFTTVTIGPDPLRS